MNLRRLNEIPSWEWPENAATEVLETLKNRKASEQDRLLAAELAGDVIVLSDELAKAMLSIIRAGKEPLPLRSQAAISLGPGLEEAELEQYWDEDDAPSLSADMVQEIQNVFHDLYSDAKTPAELRRAVLEASVRNPQSWHDDAIRSAYAGDAYDWKLTAVFCMEFVRGFDAQILEALNGTDHNILCHAVRAAGNWELDAAWPRIAALVTDAGTEKELRLAAIEAAASIRPSETEILEPLVDSYDEDISEAAMDALTEAGLGSGWNSEEDDDEEMDACDFEEEDDEEDGGK